MIAYALANNGIRKGVNMEYCINGKALYSLAGTINTLSKYAFSEQQEKDATLSLLYNGLSSIAAYLFIPYGEEGLNYVKEKIHPTPIEAFLQQRAQCLLDKTGILNDPKYQQLVLSAFAYCKHFSQKELPFQPVSVVMLATRLESEFIKYFGTTPQNIRDAHDQFLAHKHAYFYHLKESDFPSIDLDFHFAQVMKEKPPYEPFVFTDTHRKEIDGLPIFTFLFQ